MCHQHDLKPYTELYPAILSNLRAFIMHFYRLISIQRLDGCGPHGERRRRRRGRLPAADIFSHSFKRQQSPDLILQEIANVSDPIRKLGAHVMNFEMFIGGAAASLLFLLMFA